MTLTNYQTRDGSYVSLRDAMNRLMQDSFIRNPEYLGSTNGSREAQLPIDVYSTDNEFVITAAVPGVQADNVEITFEGDTLTIRGQMPELSKDRQYLISEVFHGPFSRTLQLNVPIDAAKIEATFENGILTIVLPKSETIKPRTIKVQAKK